jgi:hypothetical protein
MEKPTPPASSVVISGLTVAVEHLGRGGYISVDGTKYFIEHIEQGHFAIHFPGGVQVAHQSHLDALQSYAGRQVPRWYVENRSNLSLGGVLP